MQSDEDLPMSLRTIKLLHSIPAIPGMPAPSAGKLPHDSRGAGFFQSSRKLDALSASPAVPAPIASAITVPLSAFYAALFANTAEFSLIFFVQLLFGLGIIAFPEAESPYVLIGLAGALIFLTAAALLSEVMSCPRIHVALKLPHFVAYALCCCWLVTFFDLCFLTLGCLPLLNLLFIVAWTAAAKRYPMWACVPMLVLNWAVAFFFYAVSSPWYFVLFTTLVLSKQIALQSHEAAQILTEKGGARLPLSLGLRFWWQRFTLSPSASPFAA